LGSGALRESITLIPPIEASRSTNHPRPLEGWYTPQGLLDLLAAGTGKTRTALCLIYRLLKAGRFRRILFMVAFAVEKVVTRPAPAGRLPSGFALMSAPS